MSEHIVIINALYINVHSYFFIYLFGDRGVENGGDDVVECCIANFVSLINMVSLPSDSQIVEIELFRALVVRFVVSYGSPDTV